ncbi:tail fiber domain-containing protein [Winogradskyella schleiferi]|uniref:tail fiber domain-containing protein n=1 Tax=Winogradskyella schleiferi TaxID=2686078 RepID=UPI0015BEF950|nr:tail fiber domain-containing protein [Winogradskyella schleiferi]
MKTYKLIIVLVVLFTQTVISQVGVGTTNPNATLDIRSSDQVAPANNDGLLIPKIDEFPVTNPTASQDGMMVYVTGNGTPTKGFYYWDDAQTSWTSATGAKSINDLADGKTINSGTSLFLGIGAGINDDGTNNQNIGIGLEALNSLTTGFGNVAIGNNALYSNVNGGFNNAIGYNSLYNNTDGGFNVANGYHALYSNTIGNGNIANGFNALYNNTSGGSNIAIGSNALYNNTTGAANIAYGLRALYNNTIGLGNIGIGYHSLLLNTSGSSNVAIGLYSLDDNTTGDFNIAVGNGALGANTTGGYSVALGFLSLNQNSIGERNVALGYHAGYSETGSNKLYIENTSNANPLIYGEFDNDILGFNAYVGIGNQIPNARLHVTEEGTSGVQTIVAGLASNTSNRPVLQFSETADMGLAEGMSIEYNGVGLAGENRMVINGLGGNPLIQFRNDGNLNVLDGRVGVQTEFPTCAMEINHPSGSGIEGLKLSNQVDTDNWRFYVQWNTNTLALLYNDVNIGNFDDVSGVYTAISDRNLKTNISNIASVLEKIQTLQVVDYNFKFQNDSKKYVGLIAQDVEAVFPHLVNPPNEESENYTMDYSGFGVLAIKAIQEQQEEIKELKQQLQLQQKEMDKIIFILKDLLPD